jgi:hypothetical protein
MDLQLRKTSQNDHAKSEFQSFLLCELERSQTEPAEDFYSLPDLSMEVLAENIEEEIAKLGCDGMGAHCEEFLELRYQATGTPKSEFLEKSRTRSRKASDDSIPELTLGKTFSMTSYDGNDGDFNELKINKNSSDHASNCPGLGDCGYKLSNSRPPPKNLLLFDFFVLFEEVQLVYFKLANLLIESQSTSLGKLTVYNLLWSLFGRSMHQVDARFRRVSAVFNQIMATHYPTFPNFPNFSVWRMMVTISSRRPDTGTLTSTQRTRPFSTTPSSNISSTSELTSFSRTRNQRPQRSPKPQCLWATYAALKVIA